MGEASHLEDAFMPKPQYCHDLSDAAWALLEPHLPGQSGQWGGLAKDNRLFVNAVFWILRTGAPWRDLPPEYGKWGTVHQRFIRWRDKRIWEKLLEVLIDEPDFAWLIAAGHCKAYPHSTEARAGKQGRDGTKESSTVKYIWPWMRMLCRSESLLQRMPRIILGAVSLNK